MRIDKAKEKFPEEAPEQEKTLHHLIAVVAKDLKAAAKAHPPHSLSNRVSYQPKESLDK